MLDASLLVAAERRTLRFESLLESLRTEPVAIAAITASELLHGCHRAMDPAVRVGRAAFVDAVLDAVPVAPFGLAEARRHAELWAVLASEGSVIGPHDLLSKAAPTQQLTDAMRITSGALRQLIVPWIAHAAHPAVASEPIDAE